MTEIPEEVRQIIRHRVPTMDHVEVLMRLHEAAGKPVAAAELGRTAHLEPLAAANVLSDLVAGGLVAHDTASSSYTYSPRDREDRAAVDALAVMYHQRPVTLVKLVYAQPPTPVKSFADAFRLRDKPKDE